MYDNDFVYSIYNLINVFFIYFIIHLIFKNLNFLGILVQLQL